MYYARFSGLLNSLLEKNLGIELNLYFNDQGIQLSFQLYNLVLISLSQPPKSKRLITKIKPETEPLDILTSFAAASAVPPVAIKSSIIKTLNHFF